MRAVILAGGKGTRLRPYTTIIPKPLVPIGGEMPIMEAIIRKLADEGFDRVTIAVSHLSNLIMTFFGDGSKWNVRIDYSVEDTPLGTIGPLTLIPDLSEHFLLVNGDILCDIDYGAFLQYHQKKGNDVTVSVCRRDIKIDFGVIEHSDDGTIQRFFEKPNYTFQVSMGIYCLNRRIIDRLPKGVPYGFDNLMLDGIKNGSIMEAKPFEGFWLDIGRPDDYDWVNEHYEDIKALIGL